MGWNRPIAIALLTCGAVLAGGPQSQVRARADEQKADAAPQTPEDGRQQRRRRILRGVLDLVAPDGSEGTTEPLDPKRLNEAIRQDLLEPLTGQWDSVDALELRFDQKTTDFPRDRIGLFGRVTLRKTPWGGLAEVALNLFARIDSQAGQASSAVVTLDVDGLADTVALANFLKQRALNQLAAQPPAEDPAEDPAGDQEAVRQLLEATPPFLTLTDVADFLPKYGAIKVLSASRTVDLVRAELSQVNDPRTRRELSSKLAKAYEVRDSLIASSTQFVRDDSLEVREIHFFQPGGGASQGLVRTEEVDVVLTDRSIRGHVVGRIGQAGTLMYQGAKALVIQPMLQRLQNRDRGTVDRLRKQARDLGHRLEQLVEPSADAEPLPEPPAAAEELSTP